MSAAKSTQASKVKSVKIHKGSQGSKALSNSPDSRLDSAVRTLDSTHQSQVSTSMENYAICRAGSVFVKQRPAVLNNDLFILENSSEP